MGQFGRTVRIELDVDEADHEVEGVVAAHVGVGDDLVGLGERAEAHDLALELAVGRIEPSLGLRPHQHFEREPLLVREEREEIDPAGEGGVLEPDSGAHGKDLLDKSGMYRLGL
jgi:hypothetical protein